MSCFLPTGHFGATCSARLEPAYKKRHHQQFYLNQTAEPEQEPNRKPKFKPNFYPNPKIKRTLNFLTILDLNLNQINRRNLSELDLGFENGKFKFLNMVPYPASEDIFIARPTAPTNVSQNLQSHNASGCLLLTTLHLL